MSGFKPVQYYLEIYEPGSGHDVLVSFDGQTPFGAIHTGDILNPRCWEGASDLVKGALEVVRIEHMVWDVKSHIGHKTCVFTKVIPDTAESRIPAI
jgi:hypothetical protein